MRFSGIVAKKDSENEEGNGEKGMNQTVMVIGAMVLLSILTGSINLAIINKTTETYQAQSFIAATALAEGLLQQISSKAFDQNTVTAGIDSAGQLTAAASLGKEGAETISTYNDIDDFNTYARRDTIANGIFTSSVSVEYINYATLLHSNVPTYFKKVTVTVSDPQDMLVPISISDIISY
jgi:hypothetical protein